MGRRKVAEIMQKRGLESYFAADRRGNIFQRRQIAGMGNEYLQIFYWINLSQANLIVCGFSISRHGPPIHVFKGGKWTNWSAPAPWLFLRQNFIRQLSKIMHESLVSEHLERAPLKRRVTQGMIVYRPATGLIAIDNSCHTKSRN